jgi:hypothetical protein
MGRSHVGRVVLGRLRVVDFAVSDQILFESDLAHWGLGIAVKLQQRIHRLSLWQVLDADQVLLMLLIQFDDGVGVIGQATVGLVGCDSVDVIDGIMDS